MKLKVNTEIIEKLNPCEDRFNNWKLHYSDFNGDILEFLNLDGITAKDKIWVTLRLLAKAEDLFTLRVFAIDCAVSAAADASAAVDANASAAEAAAADAAAWAATALADAADAAADATAARAAAWAAWAAAADADAAAERERQVDCLAYLLGAR